MAQSILFNKVTKASDERGTQKNISLISLQKHVVGTIEVLLMSTHNMVLR